VLYEEILLEREDVVIRDHDERDVLGAVNEVCTLVLSHPSLVSAYSRISASFLSSKMASVNSNNGFLHPMSALGEVVPVSLDMRNFLQHVFFNTCNTRVALECYSHMIISGRRARRWRVQYTISQAVD